MKKEKKEDTYKSPARILAIGCVNSMLSKHILHKAVNGADMNIPGRPHSIPQNISPSITVIGCNSSWLPMRFGSMIDPITK